MREFRKVTCEKCDIKLGEILLGSSVMCPKCCEWITVEKKQKGEKK